MRYRKIIVGSMLVLVIGTIVFFKEKELLNGYFSSVKLQVIIKSINENYLDQMDEAAMDEGIYSGYLAALENEDTYYLNQTALKSAQLEARGDLFGTGLIVQWSLDNQYLMVVEVLPNSPAERVGIKVGDCITKLNDIQTVSMNSSELAEMLYGGNLEPITCEIKRQLEVIEVTLIAEEIILEDFTVESIDDILYIDFISIKDGTSHKLEQVLQGYQDTAKGLVLDLRDLDTDNIEEICKISDLFLNKDIAFKLKSKKDGMISFETQDGAYDMKLVVITNKETKGGVEALVLALEERGIQLGGNTGGNTYIKKLITFEDETGMAVAVGTINDRYGEELSEGGIEPDVRVYISEEEKMLLIKQGYVTKVEDTYFQEALKQFR